MKLTLGLLSLGILLSASLRAEDQATSRYVVKAGTRVPLVLVNSISTKVSREGDQVYLQTAFPIAVDGRIVIPQGSYVTGTVTEVKRPGRVKGRGELYVRFDTLMLPNGVKRDFRGTVSGVDADRDDRIKDKEGKIEGDSSKGKDVATIADTGTTGATLGAITGGGKGAGIGAGIGSAVGLGTVLLTRGPDVRLPRGASLEMQLDRELFFSSSDVSFLGSMSPSPLPPVPSEREGSQSDRSSPLRLPRPF